MNPEKPIDLSQKIELAHAKLKQAPASDIALFKSRLIGLKKIKSAEKKAALLDKIIVGIEQAIDKKNARLTAKVTIEFPPALPVSQQVDVISKAIEQNQVVIIAGETGSGKTTQIPKICLQLGRGVEGFIGHTQPRRIAARTVGKRIAEELQTELGDVVGYKVRFNDNVSEQSKVKLMTDGILLAEMQKDRLLRQYDTLIIDEAHERSLNIDFILGYLKQILVKRPDLKVIITSATIDPERFSKHFNNAPIIEVSGRTFPVEMRYRPLNENNDGDADVITGIINAVHELSLIDSGDILVFLNGEREIRDAAQALNQENLPHTEILPLFARLTVAEQNRIFRPHAGRNIVLATNVAETSLTVPGIRYVIDPGTARVSRYSFRTKVQRLPIEPISQASANQRAGRCGRVAAGVCIRLYSEDDFNNRPEFTDPEIVRTNLATVILQMLSLGLGDIADFPFVQSPDKRNISDGLRLLEELAAITPASKKQEYQLTDIGRVLGKFPIDPRLAAMVLSAVKLGCVEQVLAIVSALSIQDPRERPMDKQQAADQSHARFKDKSSDFLSLLNLWTYVKAQQKLLSNSQFRRLCQKEYLSYIRVREWQDIYSQLKLTLRESHLAVSSISVEDDSGKSLVHQAILSGLLSHLGNLEENREYKGARNSKFFIFPGSGVAKSSPKWIMAAELVETSRLFARMVAKIDPTWIEPLASHLIKRSYSEPHWLKKQGAVFAYEQVSLFGLIIVPKRRINFNKIEPDTCREIFIQHALVNGDFAINEPFLKQNRQLVDEIDLMEQKARRRDYLVDEQVLVEFYQNILPEQVICQRSFLAWWKKAKQTTPELLNYSKSLLLKEEKQGVNANDYPTLWRQHNLTFPVSYHFEPGSYDDGISIEIPVGILNQVQDIGFDWLIPALRLELITALIKSLPKQIRRNFVPAPNFAEACFTNISPEQGDLTEAMTKQLLRMTGVTVDPQSWDVESIAPHLRMNFKIVDNNGKLLKQGRQLSALKESLQGKVKQSIQQVADKGIEQQGITCWNFDTIPNAYNKVMGNIKVQAFPALVDHKTSVAIELFEHERAAQLAMIDGVSRLILLNIPSPIKYLESKLPNKAKLGLYFNPFGKISDLLSDCILASTRQLVAELAAIPRTENQFNEAKDYVRAELADRVLNAAIKLEQVLSLTHSINKKLKGKVTLALVQSHGDIKNHLNQLVYKGFVSKTGVGRLDDLHRYLRAIERRLEKIAIDPNQDRLRMIDVEKAEEMYQALVKKQRKDIPLSRQVLDIQWMIEEFKVSLYAQNIGTAMPISLKRIKNAVSELE